MSVQTSAAAGGTRRTGGRRGPIALAVATLVCGLFLAWLGAMPFSHGIDALCPGFTASPEGSSAGTAHTWWPPGAIECSITGPGGTTRATTVMLWRDYLSVVLLAAAVGIPAAGTAPRPRRRRLAARALAGALACLSMYTLFAGF
jgi:hypothetical protein